MTVDQPNDTPTLPGLNAPFVSAADDDPPRLVRLRAMHAILDKAMAAVVNLRHDLPRGIGVDTLFAIGETAETISKAKALVGRDIDMTTAAVEAMRKNGVDPSWCEPT